MGILYTPLLLITARLEQRAAHAVKANRQRHEPDDDTVEEWEQFGMREGQNLDFEADGWAKKVEESRPNVETDAAVLEVRELREQVRRLVEVVEGMRGKLEAVGGSFQMVDGGA